MAGQDAAFCLARAHWGVGAVYKPLWNGPYRGEDGRAAQAWVSEVRPQKITGAVAACPHLFQASMDKAYDVRLTAVGTRVFAVRIDSPDLDWRRRQNRSLISGVPNSLTVHANYHHHWRWSPRVPADRPHTHRRRQTCGR